MYPHLLEAILDAVDYDTLFHLRSVSRAIRKLATQRLAERHLIWYGNSFLSPSGDSEAERWYHHPAFPHGFDPIIEHLDREDAEIYARLEQAASGPVMFRSGLSPHESRQFYHQFQDVLASITVFDIRDHAPVDPTGVSDLLDFDEEVGYDEENDAIHLTITCPLPFIRCWTVDNGEYNDHLARLLYLHVQVDTIVLGLLRSDALPSPRHINSSGGGRLPVCIIPETSTHRVVIHVEASMACYHDCAATLGLVKDHTNFGTRPDKVVIVFQEPLVVQEPLTTSLDRHTLARLLGLFLIPYAWSEDCGSFMYGYQFDGSTIHCPCPLENVTIIGAAVDIPMPTLIWLRSWFKLPPSDQPSTVMELIYAVGDNWYGRESLEQRCRFVSMDEYAAERGPGRFNLEMGRSINGAP